MDAYSLNESTWPSLDLKYPLDPTVIIKSDNFKNEQNLSIKIQDILSEAYDTATNKYSNFYLTKKLSLKDVIDFKELDNFDLETFTTYIASNAVFGFTNTSNYWKLIDVANTFDKYQPLSLSGTIYNIDNGYYYDIQFLNNYLCKISHEYNDATRYLTIDINAATGNCFFSKDNQQDPFDPNSTQTFGYIYDRNADVLVLYKLVNDYALLATTDEVTKQITLAFPPTAAESFPFSKDNIYKLRTRYELPQKPTVYSNWSIYQQGFEQNNILIDEGKGIDKTFNASFIDIQNNHLVHSEYYNITGTDMPINILTLKNTNTPEEEQSRNNPFCVKEDEINMRSYKRIFTGANQIQGNDNIKVSYESFTSKREFKPDQLTYFHAPQDIFPYSKINIADAGFIESGSVAGDHPLKADKVFKRLADYKDTSPFGNSSGQQSGRFLCSWLSAGNNNPKIRPVWVDRYYYPQQISLYSALTAEANPVFQFTSEEENLQKTLPLLRQVVFDKISDLTIEPGCLYAYFHVGGKTVEKLVNSYDKNLIQKDIKIFKDTKYDILSGEKIENQGYEYYFDGTRYGISERISYPEFLNRFTLSFYLHSDDWNRQFANEIIGNYTNDGFGVYNENRVTPFIYFNAVSSLHIYNPNLDKVSQVDFSHILTEVIRFDQLEDYFVILDNEEIIRYNANNVPLNKYSNIPDISKIRNYFDDGNNNVLILTGGTSQDFYIYNTETNSISASWNQPYLVDYANEVNFNGLGFQSIILHKNQIYFIQGLSPQLLGDKIYFARQNFVWEFDTGTKDLLSAFKFTNLQGMNIDFEGNIWAVHNTNKVTKFNTNREVYFTKEIALSGFQAESIDNLGYFYNGDYYQEMIVIARNTNNQFKIYKLNYDGDVVKSTALPAYLSASFTDTTGGDFARRVTGKVYSKYNLNAKVKMRNVYNFNDIKKVDVKFNLSAIQTGYHHIAIRLDTHLGTMTLFVDGVPVDTKYFEQNKYAFSNFLKEPLGIGTTPFFNNEMLFEYLNYRNSFTAGNIKIKNIYFYDIPISNTDIFLHTKNGLEHSSIIYDIPSGRRNYLDEIAYVFKHKTPGNKSTVFDLEIANTNITDPGLRSQLEKRLINSLNDYIPAGTKLREIIWKDYN